jgi:Tol biopolymer transport system component
VWSADGREIAVQKRSGGEEERAVVAVSLETGETRSLLRDPNFFEDWSRDGKLILSVQRTQRTVYSVILSNLESTKRTILAEDTGCWPSPRFSPGSDRISYVTKETVHSVLHLQNVDGTSHVKYSDFAGEISQPLWSPDGSHIVFTGTQRGIGTQFKDLWAVQVQGSQFVGAAIPVVPNVEQMEFYNWSRNGQLAYRTGFRLGGIFTMPVDPQTGQATGTPRQLVRRSDLNSYCWSPDGTQIATPQGSEMIFISTSGGETIRSLSLSGMENMGRGMSWSPDGRAIAFCGIDNAKRAGIFLITIESSDVRLLVPLEGAIANYDPTWSPDSKTVAYANSNGIYVVDIEDGKQRQIVKPSEGLKNEMVHRPVFAHDGSFIAYIAQDQQDHERILATTIDGRETREILCMEDRNLSINIFDLSPDGRHIVYTPGNKRILCAPTDGGKQFRIGSISDVGKDAWAWMPKWSPKGDAITFIVTCEEYQYWVMENFLPTE